MRVFSWVHAYTGGCDDIVDVYMDSVEITLHYSTIRGKIRCTISSA